MSAPPPEPLVPAPGDGPKTPLWKNPYLIGFLVGAIILTLMPLVQRRFLKAPPPLRQLTPWELPSLGGGPVSSASLAGRVILATTELGACDSACLERQKNFGMAVRHLDDLPQPGVVLVSLIETEATAGLSGLLADSSPAWRFGGGSSSELEPLLSQLQAGLDGFLAPPGASFAKAHVLVLIDQNNAVRGYWMADGAGRGNSINAARLLAKHGPNP